MGMLNQLIGALVEAWGEVKVQKARVILSLVGVTAAVAAMIGQLVNLRFGREDELQADQLGVRFMAQSGDDPQSMVRVMQILEESSQGNSPPEFFSTHPNPENRITKIQQAIKEQFPNGVPAGLIK